MYEQLIYRNHLGETIAFGQNGIFVNENELHDYAWDYSSENGKVSNFVRNVTKKSVPVVIACADPDEGVATINNLMEYAEKDILANKPGKMIVGEYYYTCYITGSRKKKYSGKRGFIHAELEVVTDSPVWVKEIASSFLKKGTGEAANGGEGKNLDYPFDFPYDFASITANASIVNTSFASSDFEMHIFGPVQEPVIYINDHLYELTGNIEAGEIVTINSKSKTIIKTDAKGAQSNFFRHRGKESYIFEKIAPGENTVNWNSNIFGFDITLFEERSEPKWT